MKNARLHNKTTRSRPGRGQNIEAEAKILSLTPLWPWEFNITAHHWHLCGHKYHTAWWTVL